MQVVANLAKYLGAVNLGDPPEDRPWPLLLVFRASETALLVREALICAPSLVVSTSWDSVQQGCSTLAVNATCCKGCASLIPPLKVLVRYVAVAPSGALMVEGPLAMFALACHCTTCQNQSGTICHSACQIALVWCEIRDRYVRTDVRLHGRTNVRTYGNKNVGNTFHIISKPL